jgi:fucose permease
LSFRFILRKIVAMHKLSPHHTSQSSGSQRLLLLIGFLAFTSLGLPDGILGIAWPSISSLFDKPLSRLAVLQIAMTLGFFISSTNAGPLITRLGVGKLLIGSNLCVALALSGYSFAPLWPLIVAATVFLGLGGGAVDAGLNAYAAERFRKEQVTMLHAFYGLGAALGPFIMREVLQSGSSWRWGYRSILIIIIILLIIFMATRHLWKRGPAAGSGAMEEEQPVSPQRVLPARTLTALGVALFLIYTGLEVTIGAWSFTLFSEGRGIATGTAAAWVGMFWACFTGGRFFFGLFGGRWKTRTIITLMLSIKLAAALLLLQPWFPGAALPALPLLGFSCAPLFPFFVTLTPHVVGRSEASRLIGFQVAAASLGAASMPILVGVLIELLSLEAIAYVITSLSLLLVVLYRVWVGPRVAGQKMK